MILLAKGGKEELTRQTLATFSMNATSALRIRMMGPTFQRSSKLNLGTSLKSPTKRFMTAQTGA